MTYQCEISLSAGMTHKIASTNRHGMNRSDGEDDSGAVNRRRAVGLQCLSKRFSYSGLNISYFAASFVLKDERNEDFVE